MIKTTAISTKENNDDKVQKKNKKKLSKVKVEDLLTTTRTETMITTIEY
jgi:hypothetical protein